MGGLPGPDCPLAGVRVLECGDTLALAYAGRLLADLGAEVVKVESPQGDPLRRVGPFVGGDVHPERSAVFAYFNSAKRSVVASGNVDALTELATRADLVLRSTALGTCWLTNELVRRAMAVNGRLIVVDISTFGGALEPGGHPMNDLLALAAGGLLSLNAAGANDPESRPLRYRGEFGSIHAACDAVVAALGALIERLASGAGQHVDVSAQAAIASVLATGLSCFTYTGVCPERGGSRPVSPWGFYTCSDGMVLIQCTEDAEFRRLLELFGKPAWGDEPAFATAASRKKVLALLDGHVNAEIARFTRQEFLQKAFEHRVPAAPINHARDIVAWDHLLERGYLSPVRVGPCEESGSAEVLLPGRPWRRWGTHAGDEQRRSPVLGEATAVVEGLWRAEQRAPATAPGQRLDAGDPLDGLRVLDLTKVWAGPFATLQLAELGAEVVRVETATRADVTRRLPPFADRLPGLNRSGYFNQYNQGKKSVSLNLKEPAALEVLKRLVTECDVIIDNMRAGSLEKMGLPHREVEALNPSIISVAMTGFGETGPYRDHLAYGSVIDALSGTSSINGQIGAGPADFIMSLPDPTAGIHAAITTLGAIYCKQATGAGCRLECSMLEAGISAFPLQAIYGAVQGEDAAVIGNRDDLRCPHGVYRCAGDDAWVAISVDCDEEFRRLIGVLGDEAPGSGDGAPAWTLAERRRREDELDACIEAWTSQRPAEDAVAALDAAGVRAGEVLHVDEVVASEALARRGFFKALPHGEIGERVLPTVAWQYSRSPSGPRQAAPILGEHTRQVLAAIVGLTDAEILQLDHEGALT
jgi:crotonobetainyl-CoA:carnitine CoA-transferase CaiB-like acyl-CoA transferase